MQKLWQWLQDLYYVSFSHEHYLSDTDMSVFFSVDKFSQSVLYDAIFLSLSQGGFWCWEYMDFCEV